MTHVDWHPFTEEKPTKEGEYLVTIRIWSATYEDYFVSVRCRCFWKTGFEEDAIHEVIAWTEKPEPYQPEVNDD